MNGLGRIGGVRTGVGVIVGDGDGVIVGVEVGTERVDENTACSNTAVRVKSCVGMGVAAGAHADKMILVIKRKDQARNPAWFFQCFFCMPLILPKSRDRMANYST